jgi:putative multicomponent Na+:H+ antiporter subunit B
MIDNYTYVIIALLPLAALMLVLEVNPYHALVIRAILGAVAALVYAVLGAADVALTEALVGTMLAITLYVIAVRSSLVMRLGILKVVPEEIAVTPFPKLKTQNSDLEVELIDTESSGWQGRKPHSAEDTLPKIEDTENEHGSLSKTTSYKQLEAETESYFEELIANIRKIINKHHLRLELVEYPSKQALEQALMAKEVHAICIEGERSLSPAKNSPERISVRVRRLFEILQTELISPETTLTYVTVINGEEKH